MYFSFLLICNMMYLPTPYLLLIFLWNAVLFHKVINHQPYDQKADVFSFAIVLWELVTAKACPLVKTTLNLCALSF